MTNNNLNGFNALITGASSGLGLAMAKALLKNGAAVAIAALPDAQLEKTVAELQSEGLKAYAVPLNVRSEQSVNEAVAWVKDNWGRLDLLVNNAGLGMCRVNPNFIVKSIPFYEIDPEGFRDIVDVDFTGYFLVSRGFAPLMIEQGKGRIVNITTSENTMCLPGFVPYGPARAAAEAMSKIMTEELRAYGIAVNLLLPGGPVDTNLMNEESKKAFLKHGQLMSPEIMAEPILFLASRQSEGMTGERIIASKFEEWLKNKGINNK